MSNESEFNLKSIQFKTWLYFFLMAVIILAILWMVQILFFTAYYRSMKKIEIDREGEMLEQEYRTRTSDEGFQTVVEECARTNGAFVILFEAKCKYDEQQIIVDNASFKPLFMSTQYGNDGSGELIPPMSPFIDNDFYRNARSKNRFSYFMSRGKGEYIVYGAVLDINDINAIADYLGKDVNNINELADYLGKGVSEIKNIASRLNASESAATAGEVKLYLQMASPLVPMDATASVLKNQLIIVTIICILLSVVLSWLISKRISKPITEFSKVARQLARGNYNVRFEGNGYSEIEDLAETLNYATQEMSKTENLRRDFLANVSHDLRTPLTMVKAYAEMIRDISGKDPKKRVEHSQVIIDEADRLTNLVNDILNLSKLQAGTLEYEKQATHLDVLTKQVLERFDIMRERDGYIFNFSSSGDCVTMCDSARIEQVLYNLIGNAINYTGEDKKITVEVERLTPEAWKEENKRLKANELVHENTPENAAVKVADKPLLSPSADKVLFKVSDTGKGIAAEDIEAVWDRYYRANQSKRKVVGTGLGLSIVKNILITGGADYGILSKMGEGSTFWFCLDATN